MAKKKTNPFATAHVAKMQFNLEVAPFKPEEVRACHAFEDEDWCRNRPDFRLITLEGPGRLADGEDVGPTVGISLLCRSCAVKLAREMLSEIKGLRGSDIPTLGLMVLPMHIDSNLTEMLKANVTPEVD